MGENASSSSSGYEFGSSDPILLGISSYVGGAELSQQGLYNVPLASMVPLPQPKGPDNPVKPAPAIQRGLKAPRIGITVAEFGASSKARRS
jgi:hypothetical protein